MKRLKKIGEALSHILLVVYFMAAIAAGTWLLVTDDWIGAGAPRWEVVTVKLLCIGMMVGSALTLLQMTRDYLKYRQNKTKI